MKISESIQDKMFYFGIPLDDIPFHKAGCSPNYKYGYARILNPMYHIGLYSGVLLCGVYDMLTNVLERDINKIKCHDFFINQRLCFRPMIKGVGKWIFLGYEDMDTLDLHDDLPTLSVGYGLYKDNDVVPYYKNGIYTEILNYNHDSFETEYKFVKHLNNRIVSTPNNIIVDIYNELLKLTYKGLAEAQLLEKLLLIIPESEWRSLPEKRKEVELNHFVRLYRSPIFKEIPKKYRERAINEVDGNVEWLNGY